MDSHFRGRHAHQGEGTVAFKARQEQLPIRDAFDRGRGRAGVQEYLQDRVTAAADLEGQTIDPGDDVGP